MQYYPLGWFLLPEIFDVVVVAGSATQTADEADIEACAPVVRDRPPLVRSIY